MRMEVLEEADDKYLFMHCQWKSLYKGKRVKAIREFQKSNIKKSPRKHLMEFPRTLNFNVSFLFIYYLNSSLISICTQYPKP